MFDSPWLLAWSMLAPDLAQNPAHQASGGLYPNTPKLYAVSERSCALAPLINLRLLSHIS